MGFICVSFTVWRWKRATMKRGSKSLTKDEVLTFLNLFALQASSPKAYKNTITNSFEIVVSLSIWRVIFWKKNQKWMTHGPFKFNAYQDLMPCSLGFLQYKGVTFFAQCLINSFGHWENWNPKTNKEFLMFWCGSKW